MYGSINFYYRSRFIKEAETWPELLQTVSSFSSLNFSVTVVLPHSFSARRQLSLNIKESLKYLVCSTVTHQKFEPQKFIFILFILIECEESSSVNLKIKNPPHIYRELQFHFHRINGILRSTPFRPQSLFWQAKLLFFVDCS